MTVEGRSYLQQTLVGLGVAALVVTAGGCAASDEQPRPDAAGRASAGAGTFPAAAGFDYQLGGAYPPPKGTNLVVRDRTDAPQPGMYSVCYVNGFQTQPGGAEDWPEQALLREGGRPVADPDWPDEILLDTSTQQKRSVIMGVLGAQIRRCAKDGFAAVELDNLDSFTRSRGLLSLADNAALARDLVGVAHGERLAVGQKNLAEHAGTLRDSAGFDFAVAEECAAYRECRELTEAYGQAVVDIEYTDNLPRTFTAICADHDTPPATILRDRDLLPEGKPGHVYSSCR